MEKSSIARIFGGGASSLSSLTGTEQGIQAAEGGKALSWRALLRKLMERKSPLPAFTKCVKNNVLPLREDRNLGFRGGVKNKTLTSSTIHQLNMKGGGHTAPESFNKKFPFASPGLGLFRGVRKLNVSEHLMS